jgi:peptidoglycan/LPS O-acetylase OafA/YrhL
MRARAARSRWILELGLVSYGIYLLHAVLLEFFLFSPDGPQLVPLPHGGVLAYAVHIVFLVALTVPLALASWRWLERPLIGLAGTLSKRWTTARADDSMPASIAADPAAQGAGTPKPR